MPKKLTYIIFIGVCACLSAPKLWAQDLDVPKAAEQAYEFDMDQLESEKSDAVEKARASLSEEKKKQIKGRYQKFKKMSPEKREQLKKRWKKFKSLSKEEQEKIKERHERLQEMPEEKRRELKQRHRRWEDLSPEKKEFLKSRREKFRNMPPEQRKEWRKITDH